MLCTVISDKHSLQPFMCLDVFLFVMVGAPTEVVLFQSQMIMWWTIFGFFLGCVVRCVHVFVCVCACFCACVVYLCVCACMCVCVCAHACVCICGVCVCAHMHLHMHFLLSNLTCHPLCYVLYT